MLICYQNHGGDFKIKNLFACKEAKKSKHKKRDITIEGYCYRNIEKISSRSGKS